MPRAKKPNLQTSTRKKSTLLQLRRISARQWIGMCLLFLIVGLASWYGFLQSQKAAASDKLHVMASFYPVYDLARQVGGDTAIVTNVTPAGAEAHDFEPSPKTLTEILQSDLFIYHDEEMEPWVSKFVKDYNGETVRAIEGISVHSANDHQQEDDHDHLHDPHIWTDPILAKQMVANILAGFIAADPAHQALYEQNAAHLQSELSALDQKFRRQLANCQRRTIVTSHAAYHYFADRYNITILPISGLTPAQEPSASKLAELSNLVREQGITTIFFESQASPQLAQTLARETGAKTAILDPLEGTNQASLDENYVTIQEKNLASLTTALSCN